MSKEMILTLIKWVPIILFLFIFLMGLISGIRKGNRKTIRRLIYVIIYTTLITIFTPKITEACMKITIQGNSVEGYINNFLTTNEQFKQIMDNIPGLQDVILQYPVPFASLAVYLVLMLVGLPLSFPIYYIYVGIYALISKLIFKYSRFEKDENGNILKNKKGKKIKKEKKYRLAAGLVQGTEAVVLTSVMMTPLGFITRIYSQAQSATINNDLSDIEYLNEYKDILDYIDALVNGSLKHAMDNPLNKVISDHLTEMEIDGNKTTAEIEVGQLVKAAVYVEQSGIVKMAMDGFDLKTLDINKLDVSKLELAINALFNSKTLDFLVVDGVNYLLEMDQIKDVLVKYTNNQDVISDIKYKNSNEIKNELLNVVGVLKDIINAKILESYQKDPDNPINIVNEVKTEDVSTILNKVLSIEILNKLMPEVLNNMLKDYGLKEELTKSDNNDLINLLLNALDLAKTLDIANIDEFKPVGDETVLDIIIDKLYENGTIKDNTLDELANLISKLTTSHVFDDIVTTQLNKLMDQFGVNLNGQMLTNIKGVDDWKKELSVFEDVYVLYDGYKKTDLVDFEVANKLLKDIGNTKAMILVLPISYQVLFPKIGIEVDPSKIEYIDYENNPNALTQEAQFYNDWKGELTHLTKITEQLPVLNITKMEDVSLDLLKEQKNIDSISTVISEAFSMKILTESLINFADKNINELFKQYEINFPDGAINSVNDKVNIYPSYVIKGDKEYNVNKDNKYVDSDGITHEVTPTDQVKTNTLKRVWHNEVDCLSTIIRTITGENFKTQEGVSTILNSVEKMYLLSDPNVRNGLLKYAIKSLNIIDVNTIDWNVVSFSKEKDLVITAMGQYDLIEKLAKGTLDVKTLTDQQASDLGVVLNALLDSDIFGKFAADKIVEISNNAGVNYLTTEMLLTDELTEETWKKDMVLIKNILTLVSDPNAITSDKLNDLLQGTNGIDHSALLTSKAANGNSKNPTYKINTILLDMLNRVKDQIDGIELSNPSAEDLIYTDEVNAIIISMDSASSIKGMDENRLKNLTDSDITTISNLLTATLKSQIFGDSVANIINDAFTSVGIKSDSSKDGSLVSDIKQIDNWNKEITNISSLLKIATDENSLKSGVNTIFETIENTVLLNKSKANIMVKLLSLIPDSDVLTVNELKENNYALYTKEVNIIKEVLNTDLDIFKGNVEDLTNPDELGHVLDVLKTSKAFKTIYQNTKNDLLQGLKNATSSVSEIVVDTNVNDLTVDFWKNELPKLVNISKQISSLTNPSKDIMTQIGIIFDTIEDSAILNKTNISLLAANIVNKISGVHVVDTIEKVDGSWQATMTKAMDLIPKQ